MRKALASLTAAGMMAMPAAAMAFPGQPHVHPFRNGVPRKVARAECLKERKALGVTAFRAKYGTPPGTANALANCVKAKLPTTRQATLACLAQRKQLGPAAFRQAYRGSNPIRVCVRIATGG